MAKSTKASGSSGANTSTPPPAPTSGGGTYAIGAVVFGLAAVGLLYMKCSSEENPPPPPPTPAVPATATATQTATLPEFAPPPPPEEEEDAGTEDAGPVAAGKPATGGTPPAGGGGACAKCGQGVPSGALTGAVGSTAGLARGCYNRALRAGGGEGTINVSVSVGSDGSLCGARITSDTLHNPGVSSCVLGKFQSRTYPKPQSGCVVVNVPITFKMKP